MKKILTVVLLSLPLLLCAQVEEKEKKISVNVYGSIFIPAATAEEVNVLFFSGKHAIGIGPFFSKTPKRNFNPGAHLSYQFYPVGDRRSFDSFVSVDYIYFKGHLKHIDGDISPQTHHIITLGYGFNYKFVSRFYLTSNVGFGYTRTRDDSGVGPGPGITRAKMHWSQSGGFIVRLGVGYVFKK